MNNYLFGNDDGDSQGDNNVHETVFVKYADEVLHVKENIIGCNAIHSNALLMWTCKTLSVLYYHVENNALSFNPNHSDNITITLDTEIKSVNIINTSQQLILVFTSNPGYLHIYNYALIHLHSISLPLHSDNIISSISILNTTTNTYDIYYNIDNSNYLTCLYLDNTLSNIIKHKQHLHCSLPYTITVICAIPINTNTNNKVLICSGGTNDTIKLWNFEDKTHFYLKHEHCCPKMMMGFKGRYLISLGNVAVIRIWCLKELKLIKMLIYKACIWNMCCFGKKYIMASTVYGDVVLWDEEFREVINENGKHANSKLKFIYSWDKDERVIGYVETMKKYIIIYI